MSEAFHILYLVHDVCDPSVAKRVTMLGDGGATVTIMGFRRTGTPLTSLMGNPVIDLGQTYNGGFLQRIITVLTVVALLGKHRALFARTNLILARNLEMLAIGVRAKSLSAQPLVYESLDIHRLLLNHGPIGKTLRALEGWLAKRASLLITSSPAFISEYFKKISRVTLPTLLLENKLYPATTEPTPARKPGAPWVIGWFGAIRCHKSLEMLKALTAASNGQIEVIIRGRPAFDQFKDFMGQTSDTPGLRFAGPYKNPEDLARIYSEVHFTWAIDMFEEGLNSSWLLPNRIYEGGAYASVPIAAKGVETSKMIRQLGIGITLDEPKLESLQTFFASLTPESYQTMQSAAHAIPRATWVADINDCKTLVETMRKLAS